MYSENSKESFDALVEEAQAAGITVSESTTENADEENRPLYELLCSKLEGVIPDELFEKIKQMPLMGLANLTMLALGGRIALKYPHLDLADEFDYPDEVDELNDTIDGYSFSIARYPFDALAAAFTAQKNIDDTVRFACDYEGMVPLIIMKSSEFASALLINYEDRELQIPMGDFPELTVNLYSDSEEEPVSPEKAAEETVDHFAESVKALKRGAWVTDPEENDAIEQWADKHSYKVCPTYSMKIDVVV